MRILNGNLMDLYRKIKTVERAQSKIERSFANSNKFILVRDGLCLRSKFQGSHISDSHHYHEKETRII